VTPRISGHPLRRARARSSFEEWRSDGDYAAVETRAFWRYATLGALSEGDAAEMLPAEEYRVLSKATSGGGYLVPTDVAEMVIAAARAASAVAQVATEIVTEAGETLGMPLDGTHGTAAWTAESGSYTPSDRTITQQNLGAFKAATKLIVSEELSADEAVSLDAYLASELRVRLGALQETAFVAGDGSGKPLGIVHGSSSYTVVNAATGSSTTYKLADLVTVTRHCRPPIARMPPG
jgi:HK97 family phage major capsid protein